MIKDSLLLNEDQNFIRAKCFSCNRYSHEISHCPLLHYVPDKEKIIKKFEFYNDQDRNFFFRKSRMKFSFKKVVFSAEEMQKNIETEKKKSFYDDFIESKVNESFNSLESHHLENLIPELNYKEFKDLSKKHLLENNEEGLPLKQPQFMNKNIDKSSFHNLDILEKEEELDLQNEESKQLNEGVIESLLDLKTKENFRKNSQIEKKFDEDQIKSQEYLPFNKNLENSYKSNDNPPPPPAAKEKNEKKDIIFENMYHYPQYFPEMNYKKSIKAYEFQKALKNKLFPRTKHLISSPKIFDFELKLKERIQYFNKYSFKTSLYKEMILRTYEKKKLISTRPNVQTKNTVNMNMGILSRKKSFFKHPKFQESKKHTLEDLISGLIKKNRGSGLKNFQ